MEDTDTIRCGGAVFSPTALASIVESAPVAILVSATDGRICMCNREAERLFGYSRDELLRIDIDALVSQERRPAHRRARARYFATSTIRRMGAGPFPARRKDGSSVHIEVALTPIRVDATEMVVSMAVDVSERVGLVAALELARQSLEDRVLARTAELERANADNARLVADLKAKTSQLERQSREDPLTGLSNRRGFFEKLRAQLSRADRYDFPLSIAMADIDHFKEVNDRYGHPFGDRVLYRAAQLLRQQSRCVDILCRYGGEEFALALPGADIREASATCERIRQAFERHAWQRMGSGLVIRISIGVAERAPGQNIRAVLALADANLYKAKCGGRNRVVPVPPA